ncbi:granzyme K-like [Oxyura jamaicensis]|uniref:granzyme K-like n=1 Tax=Oxyura jamaicensis TaxID=8884 RepID=UPI0015A5CCBD|nr:granzyme K-like [Oxyura jamaicensis]
MTSQLLALLLSLIAVNLPLRCGCSDIIGGHPVSPHSRPYMAAIQRNNSTVCGGALVGDQWVLTAAHCRLNKEEFRVVLGAHQASIHEKEQQKFKIMNLFCHPQFNMSSMINDIMLLKLDHVVNLNKYVQPLHLPDCDEDVKHGTECTVAGWGVTSSGKQSECLQETTLKIVDRKICEKQYIKKRVKITRNMLCAGGRKKFQKSDACPGDSGGPLICGGHYSGIVSFGEKCGRGHLPGVYTRLTKKYIDWIKEIVSRNRVL